ncbi:MAG: AraC family transcriptional regulator [Paenibacillaceae bacterium]|nr:AraC family transcriptional regulator [Paenibacillaceae bacterium]
MLDTMQEHHQEFLEGYYFTPSALEKSGPGWLIRAGVSQAKPHYHMGPKMSPYHYLIFVLEGEGRLVQNHQTYELQPHDLFCLFPDAPHEYYTLKEAPLLTVWMAFDGSHLTQLLDRAGLRPQTPYMSGAVTGEMVEWFGQFFERHRNPRSWDSDLFRLGMFYRLFDILTPVPSRQHMKAALSETWLQRAAEYMRIHYAEGITIEQVASYIGIDRTHFSKKFSARYGLSPGKYIHRLRMEEAKRLLTETDYKLAEIAQLVGYPDLFSFSKGFKRTCGLSPSRYRPTAAKGMALPEPFVRRIAAEHGKPGEQWLRTFPKIITYCENKWSMQTRSPYPLSGHYVAPVVFANGGEAVLKLGVPCREDRGELEALRILGGSGVIRLLDAEPDRGIMLLEKASPGQTLYTVGDEDEAARIAAGVMKAIAAGPQPDAPDFEFEAVSGWTEELHSYLSRYGDAAAGPVPEAMVRKAGATLRELLAEPGPQRLLHGNLHHGNIVASSGGSWVAIDPAGIMGEAEYEAVAFLGNRLPAVNPAAALKRRLDIISEELGLSQRRMLAWGFCRSIRRACRQQERRERPGDDPVNPLSMAGWFHTLLAAHTENHQSGKEVESA